MRAVIERLSLAYGRNTGHKQKYFQKWCKLAEKNNLLLEICFRFRSLCHTAPSADIKFDPVFRAFSALVPESLRGPQVQHPFLSYVISPIQT